MLVQYLVGLCCLRHDPDAVDVTVGDLILDAAAKKRRDVDITVTLTETDGTVRAFKAYEVKREGEPLDVTNIEQLCMKLHDMPAVTYRAVVSASNFTDGAIAKAATHGVELFVLKPWTEPIAKQFPDFPNVGRPDEFFASFESSLLYWIDYRLNLRVPDGPTSFSSDDSTPLFASQGRKHKIFANIREYSDAILYRSTGILSQLEPALTILHAFPYTSMPKIENFQVGPAWPHTHTLGVKEDQAFLKFGEKFAVIDLVTISGKLQWRRMKMVPEFYILESIPDGRIFAGAAIADVGNNDERMLAVTFPPYSRSLGFHQFQLSEKQRIIIRGLKIPPLKNH
ncbi:MAG: hypothetical protein ACYDIC_10320 [Desulfobaccales bacterium]